MSLGGLAYGQEPSALCALSAIRNSLSNLRSGTHHRRDDSQLPTIQPATPDKGAPSQTPAANRPVFIPLPKGLTHANVAVGSGSSTTESLSELASSSSRDSLPPAQACETETTPQKQTRSNRRTKPSRSNTRWSRGAGSSDDTGPDRKPPTSQPSEAALNTAQSPTPVHRQRAPQFAPRNPASTQGRLMATAFGSPSGDSRRGVASPRPKGRGTTLS
jgi:PAB-dependent poly(A)-specific ribonuclease subunit 3